MNIDAIAQRLREIRNVKRFCEQHSLPRRTVCRLMEPSANPQLETIRRVSEALRKEAKRKPARTSRSTKGK